MVLVTPHGANQKVRKHLFVHYPPQQVLLSLLRYREYPIKFAGRHHYCNPIMYYLKQYMKLCFLTLTITVPAINHKVLLSDGHKSQTSHEILFQSKYFFEELLFVDHLAWILDPINAPMATFLLLSCSPGYQQVVLFQLDLTNYNDPKKGFANFYYCSSDKM